MTDDRRRFTRIPFEIEAQVRIGDAPFAQAGVRDLSVGGCRLAVTSVAPAGIPCTIQLHLSGSTSELRVTVEGETVRQDTDTVAVRFTGITPDSLFLLQNILRYNAEDAELIEDEIRDHPGLR